jgi:hypothetical protein
VSRDRKQEASWSEEEYVLYAAQDVSDGMNGGWLVKPKVKLILAEFFI